MIAASRDWDRRRRLSLLTILPLLIGAFVALSPSAAHATVTVSTFAGTGTSGFSGDGDSAGAANLSSPQGVAVDEAGNVYTLEAGNRRVREVDRGNKIWTYSGNNYYCNGGKVSNQWEYDPNDLSSTVGLCTSSGTGLASAGGGHLWINNGGWFDRVTPSGARIHVAGKVTGNYSPGDGSAYSVNVNPTSMAYVNGAVYFSEDTNSLKKWANGQITTVAGMSGTSTCNYYASDGDVAAGACIYPKYVTAWSHYIYFFDVAPGWRGPVIFRVDLNESTMHLHKVAGNGSWSDSGNDGLAVNAGIGSAGPIAISSTGEVYFGRANSGTLRKIDSDSYMRSVADLGGGTGGMAFDAADNLYASIPLSNKLVKVTGLGSTTNHGTLVALGDSVAAGEGINYGLVWNGTQWSISGALDPNWSDTSASIGTDYEGCHQSDYAYSKLLYTEYTVYNMACTGASAPAGLLGNQEVSDPDDNSSAVGVPAQLGWGGSPGTCPGCSSASHVFDDHNPDVVTLTIGADDINFSGWLKECYKPTSPFVTCDTAANTTTLNGQLATQQANLRLVLTELNRWAASKSKTLKVVVTNYYNPFPSGNVSSSCIDTGAGALQGVYPEVGLTTGEKDWLVNGLMGSTTSLNKGIEDEVSYAQTNDTSLDVVPVDLSTVMQGHEFCTSDPWAYGPSIDYPQALPPGNNPAPFHPTPEGQRAIYLKIKSALGS